jgi:hypothetical protein
MEMKRILICLTSMMLGLAHADVPKLFSQKSFTSANLAEAVNHYVAIGEAASLKEFQQLSAQESSSQELFGGKGFSVNERIGWLCRILYEPRGISPLTAPKSGTVATPVTSPLRPPKFGVLDLPEKTMPAGQWPLYPVALSGSTYFVLKQGYTDDGGTPEKLTHYLAYCQNNGVFRKMPVAVPTREQAGADIAHFRHSSEWQAIVWLTNDGNSFPMGEQFTWAFITGQTKSINDTEVASQNRLPEAGSLSLR